MPQYKRDRVLDKGAYITEPGLPIPYRDPAAVDRILGPRRKRITTNLELATFPLSQAYPTWNTYHQALAEERAAAVREGRKPHPAADVPGLSVNKTDDWGPAGPSAAQIKRAHKGIRYV